MLIATSQSSKHKKHKLKAVLAFLESEAHTIDIGFVEVQGLSLPAADQHNQDEKLGQKSRKAKKKGTKLKALHHFLLMAGLGLDAAIMEHSSDALKHRFGPLAVGLSAVEELPALHPFPVEIRVGDSRQHGNLVWIGSFFFSLLELCFDVIYHLQPRPMLRRHSVAIGMLLLFVALTSILIVASVAPTIFLTLLFPVQVSPIHNSVFLDISSYIGSIFISLVLFQAIYVMIPHRHITLRTLGHHIGKSWRGALVSTAAMQLFLVLFPIYATLFLNNYIGQVGFVLILLLFFYIFMLILLLGAEINAFFAEGIRVPQSDLITEASEEGYRKSTELTLKFPGSSNNP